MTDSRGSWRRGLLRVCVAWFVLVGTSACTTYYGTKIPDTDVKTDEEAIQVGPSNEEATEGQMEYDVWHDTNL
ncbi:hypothetical protein MK489_03325 [Myxococcota bacterium]|nr:hypothetical protein [Myxococcota bacterium]